ncbi:MAG: DEAD/DEAH box helicase [Litorimonas sp.]
MTTFSELKLADPLARALSALGYEEPTPIQAEAIPHLLAGRDLLGIAQTGTGKTAAFALPSLHHIFTQDAEPPKRGGRVLVLAPTRELVGQIHDSFVSYGRSMQHLSVAKITGGVSIGKQIKRLVHGNDVIVATPGRLMDLLDRKSITLADIEILILDEADQMMDMGFIHALKKIVPLLPKDRQTLFFSATLPPKIKNLANQFLTDPVKVTVSPANSTAERVTQAIIFATSGEKPMLLADSLLQPEVKRSLVFTRTKHGADRVVKRLAEAGLPALAIHGNKSQGQRQRALDAFKNKTVDILVATDVAARGIDIPGITHVFNYEIPNVPEQYIHRIGRTARANAEGAAIAFVAPDEKNYLRDIEKLLGEKIPVEPMPDNMGARIKVIKARDAAAPVELSPDTARKGRGKSGKKKDRSRGRSNSQPRDHVSNDERPARARPTGDRKPYAGKPRTNRNSGENSETANLGGSDDRRPSRADGEGYRGRKNAGPRAGGSGRPEGQNRTEGKSWSEKPRSDGQSARSSEGGSSEGFKRKPYRKDPTKRTDTAGRGDGPKGQFSKGPGSKGPGQRSGGPKGASPKGGAPKGQYTTMNTSGGKPSDTRPTREAPSRNSGGSRPPKRRGR